MSDNASPRVEASDEGIEAACRWLAKMDGYDPDDDPNATHNPNFRTEVAFSRGWRKWNTYEHIVRRILKFTVGNTRGDGEQQHAIDEAYGAALDKMYARGMEDAAKIAEGHFGSGFTSRNFSIAKEIAAAIRERAKGESNG